MKKKKHPIMSKKSVKEVYQMWGYYFDTKIVNCLKWIYGVDRHFIVEKRKFYLKGKLILDLQQYFDKNGNGLITEDDMIAILEQHHRMVKLEKLLDA